MAELSKNVARPVRSLQTMLREISYADEDIPPVVPDGYFGGQTESAVRAFQRKHSLPVTGEVDHETWERVVREYERALEKSAPPRHAELWGGSFRELPPDVEDDILFIIQAMLAALSRRYTNVPRPEMTGRNDKSTRDCVRFMRKIFGHDDGDEIDKAFWNALAGLFAAVNRR